MADPFPLTAVWLMLPAYLANMSPVLVARLLPRLSAPIDAGRTARDGKPVLGPGKTWRGLITGTLLGGITALLLSAAFVAWNPGFGVDFAAAQGPLVPVAIGLGMGFGALAGDAIKSYFKRRTGRDRGAPWIGFDQLDFVAGGLLGGLGAAAIAGAGAWFWENAYARLEILLFIVLATPVLHLAVNWIGYKLKLKSEPW